LDISDGFRVGDALANGYDDDYKLRLSIREEGAEKASASIRNIDYTAGT